MPWNVSKSSQCPAGKPWGVFKEGGSGEPLGCHESQEKAQAQQAALYASEGSESGEEGRTIRGLWERIKAIFEPVVGRAWDGSASNYASTEAYCAACLIDVNGAAGRDTKAQSHCMLPYKKAGSSAADVEGMHAAAQRFGQVQKPSDVPEEAWSAAITSAANKLISAYNSHDETAPDSVYKAAGKTPPAQRAIALQRLYDQLWGALEQRETWAWPLDVYLDDGEVYALMADEGKLYRVGLDVQGDTVNLGEWVQVMEVHQPVGRMLIRRQSDGAWRWFSIAATAVLNRVGEIDSTALFDRFVERFKAQEPEARPRRDFFHLGDAGVFGDVDFLERDGWCLIASGTFHDTPLGNAMRRAIQAEPERWGDSISYLPLAEAELVEVAEGVRVPVYNDGELRFISSLYENRAASPFTTARVQEVRRMRAEIVEALKGLKQHGLPDEEIDAIVDAVDNTNRQIDDENLVRREAEEEGAIGGEAETEPAEAPEVERDAEPEPEAEVEPEPEAEPEPDQEREVALDDEAVAAIVAQVMAQEQIADLERLVAVQGEQIGKLRAELDEYHARAIQRGEQTDKRLKALEQDEDEKRREWQADLPARQRTVVTYRPREAKAEEGQDQAPNLANIAEATLSNWK